MTPDSGSRRTSVHADINARKIVRAEVAKRVLILMVAIAFGAGTVLLAQIHQTQLEGTPVGQKILAGSERILECTDPGGGGKPAGACYLRTQQQTAKAVGDISASNIIVVVCALAVPNGTPLDDALQQVTKCVAKRLASPNAP